MTGSVIRMFLLFSLSCLGSMATEGLTPEKRKQIVDTLGEAMVENYVFPDVGKKMASFIKKQLKEGAYDQINDPNAMADQLTADFQSVSKDLHIRIAHMAEGPMRRGNGGGDGLANAKRSNFGFNKVEILPGNVGYIDLRGFFEAENGGATATAAMNFLANTDAIIFDLRQNGGGSPSMIQHISSYLFDEATHLNTFYVRETDSYREFWTTKEVQGPKMTKTPVFVLTSKRTFSAAEEFSYNLKHLKRGTIVGETTGGGAHPVNGHFFDEISFMARIPFGRAINPVTKTNWEGTGVKPHIEMPQAEALERAHVEALTQIAASSKDEHLKKRISNLAKNLSAQANPKQLSETVLKTYVGTYGPRQISFSDGKLFYQRQGRQMYELLAIDEENFALKGNHEFQLRFVKEQGKIVAVEGIYDNGHQDRTPRTNDHS